MPTTKKRLNITLSRDLDKALSRIAARDEVPEATKAAELLRSALEVEEDEAWEILAKERDRKNAKYLKHAKAWK